MPDPGEPIETVRPQPDPAHVAAADLRSLRKPDNLEFVKRTSMWLIDRPGKYSWQGLRDLAWRVSPTGPRVLSVLGGNYEEAWGQNRSGIHRGLVERGQGQLAEDYAAFYLCGWEYFLSGAEDTAACHAGILAGIRVLQRGQAIGAAAD